MIFSTSIALLAAPLFASAAPIRRQATLSSSFMNGAVYVMSNEPTGGRIITADIGSNGQLTIANSVATLGNGMHGATNGSTTPGPDSLYSQGAIAVSSTANLLAAVNSGSNTVSLFSIDPMSPSTLTALGAPMSSGGEFPISVAFNADGSMLCALNAGQMDGVQCFDVNATMGMTTMANTRRLLNIGQTTPPVGPLGTASQVAFSMDGTQVFAAIKGNPDTNSTGYIAAWNMTPSGLSDQFTQVPLPAGAVAPFSMTPIPGINAFFSADAGVGVDVFDFSNGVENVAASPRTQSYPIANQMATCWSAYSPMTKNFYTTDILTSTISEVSLDMNNNLKPSLVNQYPIIAGGALLDLEVGTVNNQDYLYVLMPNVSAIEVLRLDAPGNVTSLQQMDLAGPSMALNMTISPAYLVGMATYIKQTPAQ